MHRCIIKGLLHDGVKNLKIETAVSEYQQGKRTIRECVKLCRLEYRDFLNELAERNLIGGNAKLQQVMLKDTANNLGNFSR